MIAEFAWTCNTVFLMCFLTASVRIWSHMSIWRFLSFHYGMRSFALVCMTYLNQSGMIIEKSLDLMARIPTYKILITHNIVHKKTVTCSLVFGAPFTTLADWDFYWWNWWGRVPLRFLPHFPKYEEKNTDLSFRRRQHTFYAGKNWKNRKAVKKIQAASLLFVLIIAVRMLHTC